MSMMVSFVLSFFPRDVLDEILNLIGSVSEGFPSYSSGRSLFVICVIFTQDNNLSKAKVEGSLQKHKRYMFKM